jgi:hypothetical protein
MNHGILGEHFFDRVGAPFVPDFLEPAPHQFLVCSGHRPPRLDRIIQSPERIEVAVEHGRAGYHHRVGFPSPVT